MKNILSKISIIFLLFGFASCAKKTNEPVKIRVVNLEGKVAPVNIKTMDLNVEALQQQGKVRSKYVVSNFPEKNASQQNEKLENETNIGSNIDLGAPQPENNFTRIFEEKSGKNEIFATKVEAKNSAPLIYKLQNDSAKEVDNVFVDNDKEAIEIDLSTEVVANKVPEKKAKKIKKTVVKKSKVQAKKEYFIQVGSFGSQDNASNKLADMEKFHSGEVKQEMVNGAITNRVLLGPFTDKNNARKLLNEVKNSGHEAILIKEIN